jgi:hypothetical protein
MHRAARFALALMAALLVAVVVPHRVARHRAQAFLDDPGSARTLGEGVAAWLEEGLDASSFSTGSERFDGEWLFGTHVMAALGFGQLAMVDSDPIHLVRMDAALTAARAPALRAFDRAAWDRDALDQLEHDRGHIAFLGYYGLALALRRNLGSGPHDGLEARVTDALKRRLEAAEPHLVETYPGERYPVDNAAAVGALAQHARAMGRPPPPVVSRWIGRLPKWRHPSTGLLLQSIAQDGVHAHDSGRASGTALAAYFLSFADQVASRSLYEALIDRNYDTVLGFGALSEFAEHDAGHGDIDSGPLVAGYSISGTGFALAGARIHDDRAHLVSMFQTAWLFGAPITRGGRTHFITGGPLGDAILFAMLTAVPGGSPQETR